MRTFGHVVKWTIYAFILSTPVAILLGALIEVYNA